MTSLRTSRTMLCLVALLVAGLPVASGAADGPLLALEGDGGHQWVAVRFVTDGAAVTGTFTVYQAHLPRQVGVSLYDEDDVQLTGSGVTQPAVDDGRVVLRVGVEDADTDIRHGQVLGTDPSSSLSSRFTLAATPQPATRLAVVWAAGAGERWTFTLTGGPGARLLGVEHGPETLLAWNTDFDGGVHAEAYAVAGARAQVGTHLDVPVDGVLLGFRGQFSGSEHTRFEMETPAGELVACPCPSWHVAGDRAHGPGGYRFHLTGVGAGPAGLSDTFVGAASVHLPEIDDAEG